MEPDDYDKAAGQFKLMKRKCILSMGYDIVLNIGDQESDFEGGLCQHAI